MSISEKLWGGVTIALTLATFAGAASATPEYPEVIDAALQTSCPRPNSRCLICHTTSRGGQGTAMQPFARDLIVQYLEGTGNVLRGRDSDGLRRAMEVLADTNDADADGETDKDELFDCGNPSGEDLGVGPEYGCDGAHLGALPRGGVAALLSMLGFAGLTLLRRTRPPKRATANRGDRIHR